MYEIATNHLLYQFFFHKFITSKPKLYSDFILGNTFLKSLKVSKHIFIDIKYMQMQLQEHLKTF